MNPTALLARITKVFSRFSYGARVEPVRDWLILISVWFLLLIAASGWSYFIFEEIDAAPESAPVGAISIPSTAPVDSVKAIFAKRTQDQAHYLTDAHFVDPSH